MYFHNQSDFHFLIWASFQLGGLPQKMIITSIIIHDTFLQIKTMCFAKKITNVQYWPILPSFVSAYSSDCATVSRSTKSAKIEFNSAPCQMQPCFMIWLSKMNKPTQGLLLRELLGKLSRQCSFGLHCPERLILKKFFCNKRGKENDIHTACWWMSNTETYKTTKQTLSQVLT